MLSRLIVFVSCALLTVALHPQCGLANFETGQEAYRAGKFGIALREWEAAAAEGDVRAQFGLSKMLFKGEVVARDIIGAKKWLQQAAEGGHPDAQVKMGRLLVSRRDAADWTKALAWWRKAEAQGSPASHYYLGLALLDGKGIKKNIALALTHFRVASGLGNAAAQNRMGSYYAKGRLVPQDPKIAVAFWKSAVAQGHRAAEYNLGNAFRRGQGVAKDYGKAIALYSKAAERGHARAMHFLGVMHREGFGVPKSAVESTNWFERAARTGLKYAQYEMGLAYQSGIGVPQDASTAKRWYKLAADQGYEKAATHLAGLIAAEVEARRKTEQEIAQIRQQEDARIAKKRRLAGKEHAERQRKQQVAAGKKRRRTAGSLPEPGPKAVYKGKTLIGSSHPDVRNEDFFTTVKKAIDLSRELPKELQEYIQLVGTIIYDPPSKHRKTKGIQTDIVGVYTIVDIDRKGPIIIYKDLIYSSPLQVSMSLLGNGLNIKRHLRIIYLKKQVSAINAGRSGYSSKEKSEFIDELEDRISVLYNSNPVLVNRAECENQILQLKADKAFDVGQQKIGARMRLINQRKCW